MCIRYQTHGMMNTSSQETKKPSKKYGVVLKMFLDIPTLMVVVINYA